LTRFGHALAGLARISEERHRRHGANQKELLRHGEKLRDLLAKIRNALDRHAAGAQFGVRREGVAEQARPGFGLHAARGLQPFANQRCPAQQNGGLPAVGQEASGAYDGFFGDRRRADVRKRMRGALGRTPGAVGRQDQRCDPPGADRAAWTARAASPATDSALFDS